MPIDAYKLLDRYNKKEKKSLAGDQLALKEIFQFNKRRAPSASTFDLRRQSDSRLSLNPTTLDDLHIFEGEFHMPLV
jgi:hypothetical protein